ncbi:MAG: translation initiation factor Sui1 [Geobacteraceae bacterium]|nr:translation initiation factor Sui1 [Geobacteraceae bacterium]
MKRDNSKDTVLVYSSELGRICPDCGRPAGACICRRKSGGVAGDGIVRVRRETKGRGGKTVTVVLGVPLDEQGVRELAGELKRRCGTGGTVKDGSIEIQGDHCEFLAAELQRRGFRVKRAGG